MVDDQAVDFIRDVFEAVDHPLEPLEHLLAHEELQRILLADLLVDALEAGGMGAGELGGLPVVGDPGEAGGHRLRPRRV